ncbi:alpha/beta hydrolase fold [Trichococcus palustris]|uniref:Alpha/beta hydrolase fold n=1 Tax=Trichococcus palustris TaxID=140314 RepID=A0A143YT81_9LACT|nr:accessory Sec system protein Asp2 [Trichococcus palustris]CZQ96513.1 alpha/beta hydrolase fold [Trichococcus palustris]SFK73770.1 Accessory Sec system GspB-transporter [Trichococcus palustris]
MKKIEKYIEYATTKALLAFKQKTFVSSKRINIRYLFQADKSSDALTVVFSACTRAGIKARYNYVRTLKDTKTNKLFILDDYSTDGRGSYYLGNWPTLDVEEAIKELIDCFLVKLTPRKVIFCGTSKGAYASLYYGLQFDDVNIVIGSPQYFLGNYLDCEANKVTFDYIRNGTDKQEIREFLNELLPETIRKSLKPRRIYLHYSDLEHTYKEHIQFLIQDLKENRFEIVEDVAHYTDHWDVSYHFPKFLKEILGKEMI